MFFMHVLVKRYTLEILALLCWLVTKYCNLKCKAGAEMVPLFLKNIKVNDWIQENSSRF